MARTRYRIFENEQEYPYFMTCTIVGWLPVFTRPETVQIVLDQFARLKLAHKKVSEYQFWQEGSKPKQVRTDDMMWQKLEYVDFNPVNRGYVDDPIHWRYSSARNYAGEPGLIDVITDWM